MPACDPNELFAFGRVCQDPAVVNRLRDKFKQRLDAIQTSRMGPKALADNRQSVHVQPSDEATAGGSRAEPLTGPNPGWNGSSDLGALAEANRKREDAQKDSLRGPGPAPVHVSAGPVPDDQKKASVEIAKETNEKVTEANRKAMQSAPPAAPGLVVPPPPQGTPTPPAKAVTAATPPPSQPKTAAPPTGQNQAVSEQPKTAAPQGTAAASSKGEGKAAQAAATATSQQTPHAARAEAPKGK